MRLATTFACLLATLLSGAALAQAGSMAVRAPADRLALPGAFVTLVYVVTSPTSGQAQVEITSQHGYPLLAPPPTLDLTAGVAAPVAATVEIPADAPALTVDQVTLTVTLGGARGEGTVHVTIGEKRGLAIQAPSSVPVSAGGITFTLVNQGNVEETGSFQVTQNGKGVLDRKVTLGPSERKAITVAATVAGTYEAAFVVDGQTRARALTRVVQEGVPAPPPILLHADVGGSIDTNGSWGFSVRMQGSLSDYLTTTGLLYGDRLGSSSLSLDAPGWLASVGALGSPPLGLALPSELGVLGGYKDGPWAAGGGATWVGADRFSGYAFGGRKDEHTTYSGAVGLHAGAPMATATARQDHEQSGWQATATLLDGSLSGSASARQRDPGTHGTATVSVGASRLLTDTGTLQFAVGYADRLASLYGSVTAPIGSQATGSAKTGTVLRLPVPIAGSLYLKLQGGTDESFAALGYAAVLDGGWQTADSLGITTVSGPLGIRGSTSWTYVAGPGNTLGADADLVYTPSDGSVTGRVAARYAAGFGPAAVSVSTGWDLTQQTLGIGSALSWDGGPWSVQVSGDAGLDTITAALSFGFGLTGHLAFDLDVPENVVSATGGRKLGTINGYVHAGKTGIPDVTVRVGSYRVRTDEHGRFHVRLPPGDIRLGLELSTLPIQYQVEGGTDRAITLAERQTAKVEFPVVASAGLTGSVLLDSDGNGTPDVPPRSGGGTILLTTASVSPRALTLDANGGFVARGLVPGRATLKLSNLPLGFRAEGSDTRTVQLEAGQVRHITFLVQPVAVSAPVFGASSFRIRSVETEINKAPPGAAPLVTVKVQGHADTVNVIIDGTERPLTASAGDWVGRVPVPRDAKSGVLRFQIVATSRSTSSSRDGQLVIDPSAAVVEAKALGIGKPGAMQDLSLVVYLQASKVEITSPFGGRVLASETEPGRWTAELQLPSSASPETFTAGYAVTTEDGRTLKGEVRFRVIAP